MQPRTIFDDSERQRWGHLMRPTFSEQDAFLAQVYSFDATRGEHASDSAKCLHNRVRQWPSKCLKYV